MNVSRISDVARYWAGLALLERLGRSAAGLTSEEVCSILGARNVKGIGAALSCTRLSLRVEEMRLDEALLRRQVRGLSLWSAGPWIAQARHVLEHARRMWTWRERKDRMQLTAESPGSTHASTTSGSRPRPADRVDRGDLQRPNRTGTRRAGAPGARGLRRERDLGARAPRIRPCAVPRQDLTHH